MAKRKRKPPLIPDDVLIQAGDRVKLETGKGDDKWWEHEATLCRKYCGEQYAHVESDYIRDRYRSLRKNAKTKANLGGKTKRKLYKREEYHPRYQEYLQSAHWSRVKEECWEFWRGLCAVCRAPGRDVHHNTYDTLGAEELRDVILLCRECHRQFHRRLPDPTWPEANHE